MTREAPPKPRFHSKQLVHLLLHNVGGQLRNEFARMALPYTAQVEVLIRCQRYRVSGVPLLIYSVKFEDGKVLKLPEDCLYEHKGKYY